MTNPFVYGVPVRGSAFVGRADALRRVLSRIAAEGQATALVGEPGIGKTSLMSNLPDRAVSGGLTGAEGERLLFQFLDAHTLPSTPTAADFWERALICLDDEDPARMGAPLQAAWAKTQESGYAALRLERLFDKLDGANLRLVLFVDEFDALLQDQGLGPSGFFGSLRSLASRFSALSLVLSSHYAVDQMHDQSRAWHHGSPILNFVDELTLGPLTDEEALVVLDRAVPAFGEEDRRFLLRIAGGYPLLLQASASELYAAHKNAPDQEPASRRSVVGQRIRDVAARTLNANWQVWSAPARRAFAVVALANLNSLGRALSPGQPSFDVASFLRDLDTLGPEIRMLEQRGILEEDLLQPGSLRVRAEALLWWFADKAIEVTRPEIPFEQWLQSHQLEGVWRRDEKDRLRSAIDAAFAMLKSGAGSLIDAAARGIGGGLVGGLF